MPEKVTRQEKIISLAIEKARKAKEELSAKQRKNIEPTQVLEIDTDPEVEKIKRPKVQDASKITNQTQKKEGYGLAGESIKKAERTIEQDDEAYSKMLSNFELEFKKALKKLRKFVRKTHPDEAPSLKILEEMLEGMKINLESKRRNNTKLIQENR